MPKLQVQYCFHWFTFYQLRVPGVRGVPGLLVLVAVGKDPEFEVDLATQLGELIAARETTPKLNPASTTESVSFDIVYNSVNAIFSCKNGSLNGEFTL